MPELVYAQPASAITDDNQRFPPVTADELGFALNIFVAAASGALIPSRTDSAWLTDEEAMERDHLLDDLLVHSAQTAQRVALPQESSLGHAFGALWNEYGSHELRDSICARVLCFYFLMERTEGRAVGAWTTSCPERPEQVLLHSAVIQGLASIPLDAGTGLVEAPFLAAIREAHVACLLD